MAKGISPLNLPLLTSQRLSEREGGYLSSRGLVGRDYTLPRKSVKNQPSEEMKIGCGVSIRPVGRVDFVQKAARKLWYILDRSQP